MTQYQVAFVLIFLFASLIFVLSVLAQRKGAKPRGLRQIEAYESLPATVGAAVETGRRIHISVGDGAIGEVSTPATLAGLSILDQIASVAAISDKPPIVTTSDGVAMLLAQDTLRGVYKRQNANEDYDGLAAQVVGLSPLGFGAALTGVIKDDAVAGTILIGSVGSEAVLLAEAGQRAKITTVAGSDQPAAQALLFAAADQPLVGEDLFAGNAYINRRPEHLASLRAQDWARIAIGAGIVLGVLYQTAKVVGVPLP
jgi:hypothetical protein